MLVRARLLLPPRSVQTGQAEFLENGVEDLALSIGKREVTFLNTGSQKFRKTLVCHDFFVTVAVLTLSLSLFLKFPIEFPRHLSDEGKLDPTYI